DLGLERLVVGRRERLLPRGRRRLLGGDPELLRAELVEEAAIGLGSGARDLALARALARLIEGRALAGDPRLLLLKRRPASVEILLAGGGRETFDAAALPLVGQIQLGLPAELLRLPLPEGGGLALGLEPEEPLRDLVHRLGEPCGFLLGRIDARLAA